MGCFDGSIGGESFKLIDKVSENHPGEAFAQLCQGSTSKSYQNQTTDVNSEVELNTLDTNTINTGTSDTDISSTDVNTDTEFNTLSPYTANTTKSDNYIS